METNQPKRGLPRRRRTQLLAGLAAVGVLLALLQRTGFALFPPRHDDTILGFATGVVLGALVFWALDRRP